MEISPSGITAGVAVCGLIGGVILRWVDNAVRSIRTTQTKIFEKLDLRSKEFQDYRVHVAETYIAEDKLEKIIAPVVSRLDRIEDDLRGKRT